MDSNTYKIIDVSQTWELHDRDLSFLNEGFNLVLTKHKRDILNIRLMLHKIFVPDSKGFTLVIPKFNQTFKSSPSPDGNGHMIEFDPKFCEEYNRARLKELGVNNIFDSLVSRFRGMSPRHLDEILRMGVLCTWGNCELPYIITPDNQSPVATWLGVNSIQKNEYTMTFGMAP